MEPPPFGAAELEVVHIELAAPNLQSAQAREAVHNLVFAPDALQCHRI